MHDSPRRLEPEIEGRMSAARALPRADTGRVLFLALVLVTGGLLLTQYGNANLPGICGQDGLTVCGP